MTISSEISATFREAARRQREHLSITYEYGNTLVDLVCEHGDFIAAAVNSHAALLAAAKAFVAAGDDLGQHGTPFHLQAHYDVCKAAIASAEEPAP